MIDAYTIGITLALNDGVSAGIASIRRELSALDLAISKSTAGLNLLNSLGRQVSTPDPTGLRRTAPNPPRKNEPEAVGAAEPADAPLKLQARTDPPGMAPQLADPTRTLPVPVPVDPVAREQEQDQPRWTGGSVSPVTEITDVSPSMAPVPVLENDPGHALNKLNDPTADSSEKGFAALGSAVSFPPLLAAGVGPAEVAQRDEREGPRSSALGSAGADFVPPIRLAEWQPVSAAADMRQSRAFSADPRPDSTRTSVAGSVETDRGAPDVHRPVAPAAETGAEARSSIPDGLGTNMPPIETRSTASVGAAGALSDSGGLYLDGARIGRWMFDRLAERASRPQAGFTGLDPRLTPSFPGAPFDS